MSRPQREASSPKKSEVRPLPSLQNAPELAGLMMIRAAGENPKREGLLRTPARFGRAWKFLTSGYRSTPEQIVGNGVFHAESKGLVCVKNIEFYSLCEHHMLPFWGNASVAYYPGEKILGLSKIPRLVDLFARRLQVQERLTQDIAFAIQESIDCRAVVCRITACHLCMMMRGVEKQGSSTVTEAHFGIKSLNATERKRIWESL